MLPHEFSLGKDSAEWYLVYHNADSETCTIYTCAPLETNIKETEKQHTHKLLEDQDFNLTSLDLQLELIAEVISDQFDFQEFETCTQIRPAASPKYVVGVLEKMKDLGYVEANVVEKLRRQMVLWFVENACLALECLQGRAGL